MWRVKFLSGPLAGKSISLRQGRNVVGRAPHCDVVIPSPNVSKEHATIEVYNDKIILTDLKSRNGTFVNGVQITGQKISAQDKVGFFDILCVVSEKSQSNFKPQVVSSQHQPQYQIPPQMYHGNVAYQASHQHPANGPSAVDMQSPSSNTAPTFFTYVLKYFDEVVLPGVYKLTEWMEYRTVLALFVAAYIALVTSLSTIPLVRILKASIEKEAQNRAQTIARSLARDNRSPLMLGQRSLVTTENAEREPGAKAYVIASPNGDIMAPPQLAGQYLTDVDYVNEARKLDTESVHQINESTIVAVAPIRFNNPQVGGDVTAGHAVVVYNMGTLAVDDGRTLSLFIQVLFIATLVGGLLFFFLYKIVLLPIQQLNSQLNLALRDGTGQVQTNMDFPELQLLASNINSAVSRGEGNFASKNMQNFEADRTSEMQNIVNLLGYAAVAISPAQRTINAVNETFTSSVSQGTNWTNMSIDRILDTALKLNIGNLVDRVTSSPSKLATDSLDISGKNHELYAIGIQGTKDVAYIVIVFIPKSEGG